MAIDFKTRPNVWPWPPILLVVGLVAAIGFGAAFPRSLDLTGKTPWLGFVLIAIGLALAVWAIVTMRRAHTNTLAHRGADRLVDWGPFAISRNPIYLGLTLAFFGVGVAANDAWIALAALLVAAAIQPLAIAREERHLAARFVEWERYAAETPRWFGLSSFRFRRRDDA